MITRDGFTEFFVAVNDGQRPFAWQHRLLDYLLEHGSWPDRIAAPTGSGKSNVVDVHVYANALSVAGAGPRLPRRLFAVVGRRALVDSQADRAAHIRQRLEEADGGVLSEVASALRSLTRNPGHDSRKDQTILHLASLRGGARINRAWLPDPRACAVINATPDMYGSRLLIRGYGSSRLARPREAGLCAYDAVLILDEAHLNRQLVHTARRISELECEHAKQLRVPGLQVVETSATQARAATPNEARQVGVQGADLVLPGTLTDRLTRPKPVNYVAIASWSVGVPLVDYVKLLADEAEKIAATISGAGRVQTVLCVVNRVDTATRLHAELSRRHREVGVELWVGRMRPIDLLRLKEEHPGLFTVDGDPAVRYLVATQTVEVGVDIDAVGLITELSSGPALAQRAGRANRLGVRDNAPIVVVGPPKDAQVSDQGPYTATELGEARDWLLRIAADPSGASPWVIRNAAPPEADLPRKLLQRPEFSDARRWSFSSAPTFVENASGDAGGGPAPLARDEDLALWLSDDLDNEDWTAGIVVRSWLPESDTDALSLIAAVPPDESETFPASIKIVRKHADWILEGKSDGPSRAFLVRGKDAIQLGVETPQNGGLQPGDVLVVESGHALTTSGVVVESPDPSAEIRPSVGSGIATVISPDDRFWRHFVDSEDLEPEDIQDFLSTQMTNALDQDDRDELAHRLSKRTVSGALQAVRKEERAPDIEWELWLPPDHAAGDRTAWIALADKNAVLRDPEWQQELTSSSLRDKLVPLREHNNAVGHRAEAIGRAVGLPDMIVNALRLAGRGHDLGKSDSRFQTMLGRLPDEPELAKGKHKTKLERARAKRSSGLPTGWRHEQLSAGLVDGLHDLEPIDQAVVRRLIGTSHGHIFPFRHMGPELWGSLNDDRAKHILIDLFEHGVWEEIIERTDVHYGVWGMAYLHAILREADGQVSAEGS